jgi:hypothetical protein
VQFGVGLDHRLALRQTAGLDASVLRVPEELEVGLAGEVARVHARSFGLVELDDNDLDPRHEGQTRLEADVVADRDAQLGQSADEAVLTHTVLAALARERTDDSAEASELGAVADDRALRHAALDHAAHVPALELLAGLAAPVEGARVVVHGGAEHDGRALDEVGAQAGVRPDAESHPFSGHDVRHHRRDLVGGTVGRRAHRRQFPRGRRADDRSEIRPDEPLEDSEDPIEVHAVRFHLALAQQRQAQPDVGDVGRLVGEVLAPGQDGAVAVAMRRERVLVEFECADELLDGVDVGVLAVERRVAPLALEVLREEVAGQEQGVHVELSLHLALRVLQRVPEQRGRAVVHAHVGAREQYVQDPTPEDDGTAEAERGGNPGVTGAGIQADLDLRGNRGDGCRRHSHILSKSERSKLGR